MLGKFPKVSELVAFAAKMTAATAALEGAKLAFESSAMAIVEARVDVRYIDMITDSELLNLIRRVELADGKAGGRIFKLIAPEGKTALVKPFGQSQVKVLVDTCGVLNELKPTWAGAAQEWTLVDGLRDQYDTALKGRDAAWQSARNLRVARNLAREAFIKAYLEISYGVKALYPDDKKMQDLFFDDVSNDVEKDLGEDEEPAAPGGAEGGSAPTG